ncbi:hypothetical protein KBB68_04275 [Candidatus Babeliales bacterium]|nr:hypothetical protein [Candidatus Babeliales bacterium]
MTTFTKKIFLTTLLATSSLSFSKLSEDAISDCFSTQREGAAKYLEFHFVFQPNNKLQTVQTNLTMGIGFTAATAFLLAKFKTEENTYKQYVDNSTLIASGMLCVATGYYLYNTAEYFIKSKILVNFLKNWSHHRQFLPEDFTTAFDELAAYQQDGKTFSADQVEEIFELVLHYIEHSFEKRYPKEKKSTDLLSSVKTITEIGKNCAPGK